MPTMVEITKRADERALRALALRREGKTFREVGEAMGGICAETARCAVSKGARIEKRRNRSPQTTGGSHVGD